MARPLDIPRIALGPATGPSSTDAPALESWRVGQILSIRVVEAPAPGRAVLMMAGQRIEAQTEVPLTPGQRLTARVETTEPPQVLRILTPADPGSTSHNGVRAAQPLAPAGHEAPDTVLREALRSVLPSAGSLKGVLESLPALPQASGAAGRLLATLPTVTQVSQGPGLRAAVEDSGTFLEARLATMAPGQPPLNDLKARLLRLAALLPRAATQQEPLAHPSRAAGAQNPPRPSGQIPDDPSVLPAGASGEALRAMSEIEAAVARIELNQLRAVPHSEGPHPGWLVEVPVRSADHLDVLSLHIEPEADSGLAGGPGAWTVSLALDLEPLGPVQARVVWQAGSVATTIWAEDPATLDLLRQRSEDLTAALRGAGLEPRGVRCLPGPGPGFRAPRLPDALLDLRA